MQKKTFPKLWFSKAVNSRGERVWEIGPIDKNGKPCTVVLDSSELHDLYLAILPEIGRQNEKIRSQTIADIKRLLTEQQAIFKSILKILETKGKTI